MNKPFDNVEILLRVRNLLRMRHLTEHLRVSRSEALALSQRIIKTQEDERRDLARELHDEIGQTLTVVKINLQSLRRILEVDNEPHLDHSISVVERALRAGARFISEFTSGYFR